LLWLIPLVVSFGFYNQEGELNTDFWIFKVTMIIVATITSVVLLRFYYKGKNHLNWWKTALVFLAINLVLDLIMLVGFLGMEILLWLYSVAIVYLVMIPATSYALAIVYVKE
jgi:hypothetical protein